MKRWSLAALLVATVTLPAVAGAHTDFTGRAAKPPPPPPRQLLVTLTGSGRGSWNGTDVYYSVKDGSRLPVERSGQISYRWKSVKPLSFTIPPYRDQPFDVTAQGDLTGSWQSSGSGTKVDPSYTTVEPFTCSDTHDDIPTPVNAELTYQPSDGHALLTLSPDAVFFPSVPVDCRVIYAEANVTALGGIVAQNLFQSPDVEAQLVLPSDFVTVPKAVTVNFPRERIDTANGDATLHQVNDGTVDVKPCGAYGDGVVTFVQGDASAGDDALALGSPVSDGSTVTTKGRTRLEIRLPDKSVLRIGPNSKVDLTCAVFKFGKSAEDRTVNAKLVVGDLWAKIAHLLGGDAKFEVQSGPAGGGVRGSIMEVTSKRGRSHWHDIEGDMYVYSLSAPSKKVYTKPGHCIDIVGTSPPGRPYRC